jgi:hypothetical protein
MKKILLAATILACLAIAPASAEYLDDGCDTSRGAMAFMLCQHDAWLAEHELQRERDEPCRVGICERTDQ